MSDQPHAFIENFGPPPRKFSLWDRLTYLRVPLPAGLKHFQDDDLHLLFRNMRSVFTDGVVVWGRSTDSQRAWIRLRHMRFRAVTSQTAREELAAAARWWSENRSATEAEAERWHDGFLKKLQNLAVSPGNRSRPDRRN